MLRKLFLIFIFLLLLIGGVFYYLLQPKTLGVKYTQADLESIHKKLGTKFEELPALDETGKTIMFTGSHKVEESFSSEELTAGANNRQSQYAYFPFRNVQIRVNSDGTVEGSGTLSYKDALNYVMAQGIETDEIPEDLNKYKVPNPTIPLHLKVRGNVTGNKSNIEVLSAKVASISIPQEKIDEYAPALNQFVEAILKARHPSYDIEVLEVKEGKVHFKGSSPDSEKAVRY